MMIDTVFAPDRKRSGQTLLELRGMAKTFPGVRALDDVSLSLHSGEIHALLGENGAGKSTLVKIIAGVYTADSGEYLIEGTPAAISSPRQAFTRGIAVVHQERNLVPTFSVGENVLLGKVVGRARRLVDTAAIEKEARHYMDLVGLTVAASRNVASLSAAQKQLIEIARALSVDARILLLDEPTASISLTEAAGLLATLRTLRDRGVSILYVSHKLDEVFEVCDSVTVLRDGRNAGATSRVSDLDRDRLITLMIGRSQNIESLPVRDLSDRRPVLEVADLPSEATAAGSSFTLRQGEILGWYGLVGAGRTELARAVIGAEPQASGSIRVEGKMARIRSLSEALHRWGIGYVSENRQEEGLFLTHTITRNIAVTVWQKMRRLLGLIDATAETRLARDYQRKLEIRTPSLLQLVANLSGGNKQKVNIAKWLAANPKILIIDEPTVGIDIKTKYEIHDLIWRLAQDGISVILISSDMPEMIRLADRILVFKRGRILGELPNSKDYDDISKRIMGLIVDA
jgi:ribose transport system ATP-binding protein